MTDEQEQVPVFVDVITGEWVDEAGHPAGPPAWLPPDMPPFDPWA